MFEDLTAHNKWIGKIDLIIVLGAQVLKNGCPSRTLSRRVLSGVELFKLGVAPKIVVTGCASKGSTVPEAVVMAELAVKAGVPEQSIFVEPKARNTYENIVFSQVIMTQNGWQKAVVVSDAWHLQRARFCTQRIGLSAVFHGATAPGFEQSAAQKVLCQTREALAMVKYRLSY